MCFLRSDNFREVFAGGRLKTCKKCGSMKPFTDFNLSHSSKDGRRNKCLACYVDAKNFRILELKEKICRVCQLVKPISQFSKNSTAWDGYRSNCKACHALWKMRRYQENPEIYIRHNETYKVNHPEAVRRTARKMALRKFKLTEMDYQLMFDRQNGVCAICKFPSEEGRLAIDHCHKTGELRKLLCRFCNLLLGHAGDNLDILRSAIQYLEQHNYTT